jgi:hypothetical protein
VMYAAGILTFAPSVKGIASRAASPEGFLAILGGNIEGQEESVCK